MELTYRTQNTVTSTISDFGLFVVSPRLFAISGAAFVILHENCASTVGIVMQREANKLLKQPCMPAAAFNSFPSLPRL